MRKVSNSKVKGLYIRGRTYYARLTVPKDLKSTLGYEFVQSLSTSDLNEAESRAVLLLRDWRITIENARGTISPDQKALRWKAELKKIKPPTENGRGGFDYDPLEDVYQEQLEKIEESSGLEQAQRFNKIAKGQLLPTKEYVDIFLATRTVKPRTLQQEGFRLGLMVDKFPTLPIRKSDVNKWWIELTQTHISKTGKPYSQETANFILIISGTFYQFLIDQGHLDEDSNNPFHNVSKYNGGGKQKQKAVMRLPWSTKEIELLVKATCEKGDTDLLRFVLIVAHTGARINEIAMLKIKDIHFETDPPYFSITDSKTRAGIRDVPIHPYLNELFYSMTKESTNEYLFPNLTFTSNGERASAVGKRFGNLKSKLGFGPKKVFHSFRHTVTTALLQAGTDLNIAQDIVGHEKGNITADTYNAVGSSMQQRFNAITNALSYDFHKSTGLTLLASCEKQ